MTDISTYSDGWVVLTTKGLSVFLPQATERSGIASAANSFKENLRADDGAPYDEIIEIDLDKLRPHVNGPFTPDLAHPVGAEFSKAVKVRCSMLRSVVTVAVKSSLSSSW